MKQCEWCNTRFSSNVSYQVYCSVECRESATKEKIAERQKILRRNKRSKKTRKCSGGCGRSLSIYNDDTLCSNCKVNIKEVNLQLKQIKDIINEKGIETES